MPLMENDYDVFGVLFDVRTQGLDSVKGVISGLISAESWAKKAQGGLVNVTDALRFMKEQGVAAGDAVKFISQGGHNSLFEFSNQAQRAAKDIARVADEFKQLEHQRGQVTQKLAAEGIDKQIRANLNEELNRVKGQVQAIFTRLAAAREQSLSLEATGGATSRAFSRGGQLTGGTTAGFSAMDRVTRELNATKPLQDLRELQDFGAKGIKEVAAQVKQHFTRAQQILIEQSKSLVESFMEVDRQLSAGNKPWYGERGGQMRVQRSNASSGSSSRSGGAEDPVLTEDKARRLTQRRIELEANAVRLLEGIVGDARSAKVIFEDATRTGANRRGFIDKINPQGDPRQAEILLRELERANERVRSTMAIATANYHQAVVPERAMRSLTQVMDQQLAEIASKQAGRQVKPEELANVLYPGAARVPLDSRTAQMRSQAMEEFNQRGGKPASTAANIAATERYEGFIRKARSQLDEEIARVSRFTTTPSGSQALLNPFEVDSAKQANASRIAALRRRQEMEENRGQYGATEYAARSAERDLSSKTDYAVAIAEGERLRELYRKKFGTLPIDKIIENINNDTSMTARQKRAKINIAESEYAEFLRAGKMPDAAADTEDRVRARQREQRAQDSAARNAMYSERSRQRLALLDQAASGTGGAGGSGSFQEAYQKALEEAKKQLRGGFPVGGGSGSGDNPYSPREGYNASYQRMIDAERQYQNVVNQRRRIMEDVDARAERMTQRQLSLAGQIAEAENRAGQARSKATQVAEDAASRIAAKEVQYNQTRALAQVRFDQDQQKTEFAIERLQNKKQRLLDVDTKDAAQTEHVRQQIDLIDRGVQLMQEIHGGEGQTGTRERGFQFAQGKASFDLEQFKKQQTDRVAMAQSAADSQEQLTLRKTAQLNTQLTGLQQDFVSRQQRIYEDYAGRREEADRRVARARLRYEQDSQREIDRLFSRHAETLSETRMRVLNPELVGAARQSQAAALSRFGAEEISLRPEVAGVAENTSKSYAKLNAQIEQINANMDRQRAKAEAIRVEEETRLATMQLRVAQVPPEFQPQAREALEGAQIRAAERIKTAQASFYAAEETGIAKVSRARAQYYDNINKEQQRAEKALTSANAQSMFNLMLQFGGAIAAIKGFVVETVQYAARTETMKVVTEQMARTNDINTAAVLHQISAIKALNITTQEAHGVVQRMIFAELDVAKATELARVAQDAATISGENSSETLNKIITGIVTGQTRILHYMGLQVSMQQTLRQLRMELGREPTEIEKRTAMLNAVLAEGVKISGNYEAAMLTAGKQVLSLKRQFQEAQNAIGNEFQPAYMGVISMLSRFSNVARENSSEFASLTRAVAALAAAFITLQTINFARGAGGDFLGGLAASMALRPAVTGAVAGAEGAAAGGIFARASGFMSRIPIANYLGTAAAIGVGYEALKQTSGGPMEGVQNTVASTKSQQEIDRRQMELAFRTGDIDQKSYQEAMGRFFANDQALRHKAVAAVSQVWIDEIRKAQEVELNVEKSLKNQGFFGTGLADNFSRTFANATWLFSDNKFKTAGYTFGETFTGSQAGNFHLFGGKQISSDQEFQNLVDRKRKKITEAGDVVTEAGIITVKQQLDAYDKYISTIKSSRRDTNDPLQNLRLILQQELQNLDDITQKKIDASKTKIQALTDRVLQKAIIDPVEKVRYEMESALSEHDFTRDPTVKAAISHLKSLGYGLGTNPASYGEYSGLKQQQAALGVSPDQLLAYRKALTGQDPDNPGIVHFGENGIMTRRRALENFGLGGSEGQLVQYEQIQKRIDELETGIKETRDSSGRVTRPALQGTPELKMRYELEQSLRTNKEQLANIRSAYAAELEQEELTRSNKYAQKNLEFQTTLRSTQAGPGIDSERNMVAQAYSDKVKQANDELSAQNAWIQKNYSGTEQQNLLVSAQVIANEKLRELDDQRIIALEQINQQERESARAYDVSKIEARLRLEQALAAARLEGDSKAMELATQRRDLELRASGEVFALDKNRWEFLKRNNQAQMDFDLAQISIQKNKADKALEDGRQILQLQFDRSDKLIKAQAIGPYQEDVAIRKSYELKKSLVEQEAKLEELRTNKKDAEATRRKQIEQAEFDYLTQRMELYKKQVEEGRKMAGDVFDALLTREKGKSFQDMSVAMFKTTEKQMFENLFGNTFMEAQKRLKLPGQGTMEKPTFLGKMLEGTMFGLHDDPTKEIASLNKDLVLSQGKNITSSQAVANSSDRLREAIDRLVSAVEGLNSLQVQSKQDIAAMQQINAGGVPTTQVEVAGDIPQVQTVRSPIPTTLDGQPDTHAAAPVARLAAGGDSEMLARVKAKLGMQPLAYSKITGSPIYTYSNSDKDSGAGYSQFGSNAIFLNKANIPQGVHGEIADEIVRHEATHTLLNPHMDEFAGDKDLQQYVPMIRKNLEDSYGSLYRPESNGGKPIPAQNVISEGLAYNVQKGAVPGLNAEQQRAFLERSNAMMDPETRKKYAELIQSQKDDTPMFAATPDQKASVQAQIRAAALKHGVDPSQVLGLAESESGFDQTATSSTGARGVFQFTQGTAKSMGINREDQGQNIEGGVRYWKQVLAQNNGDVGAALATFKGVSAGGATTADVVKAQQMMAKYGEGEAETAADTARSMPAPYASQGKVANYEYDGGVPVSTIGGGGFRKDVAQVGAATSIANQRGGSGVLGIGQQSLGIAGGVSNLLRRRRQARIANANNARAAGMTASPLVMQNGVPGYVNDDGSFEPKYAPGAVPEGKTTNDVDITKNAHMEGETTSTDNMGGGASASGIAGGAVMAGSAALLGYNAAKSFGKGGAYNALGGVQDILGIASMIPGIGPFAALGSMGIGLIRGIMGDPRQKAKKKMEDWLKQHHNTEADVQSRTMDTGGNMVDFDFLGHPRGGAPFESGPLAHLNDMQFNQLTNQTNANRSTLSGGQTAGLNLNVNVSTMDSRSFLENSGHIADAMRHQLTLNHPVSNEIRQIAGA